MGGQTLNHVCADFHERAVPRAALGISVDTGGVTAVTCTLLIGRPPSPARPERARAFYDLEVLVSPRQILEQAAADSEFRAALLHDPGAFGVTPDSLPEPVEEPDQEAQRFRMDAIAAVDVGTCRVTCASGFLTLVCLSGIEA